MTPNFDEIQQSIANLTPAQREQLAARCTALRTSNDRQKITVVSTPEELLWTSFERVMAERQQTLIPLGIIRTAPGWSKYRAAAQLLSPWVALHFQPKDEVERARAYRIIAECILNMIEYWDVAWTPNLLMQQTSNATQAVDISFPGYAKAGLLRSWLVGRKHS